MEDIGEALIECAVAENNWFGKVRGKLEIKIYMLYEVVEPRQLSSNSKQKANYSGRSHSKNQIIYQTIIHLQSEPPNTPPNI